MSDTHTGGVSVTGLLLVLFIGLKLAGVIDWSWWWVLAPIWVPLLIGVVITAAILMSDIWEDS